MHNNTTPLKFLAIALVLLILPVMMIPPNIVRSQGATFHLNAWYVVPPTITWNPFASLSVLGGAQGLIGSACTLPLYSFEAYHGYLLPLLAKEVSVNPTEGYLEVKLFEDTKWFNGKDLVPFTARDVWTYFVIQWKIFQNFIPWLLDVRIVDDYTIRFYFNRTVFSLTAPIYDPKTGKVDTTHINSYSFTTNIWYQGFFQILTSQITTPYNIFGKYAEMVANIPLSEVSKRYNLTALQNEVRDLPMDTPWCTGPFWPDPSTLTTTSIKLVKNPGCRWSKYVQYDSGEILFARAEEQMIANMINGMNLLTWHGISPLTLVEIDKSAGGVKGAWLQGLEVQGIWFNLLRYPFNITEVRWALSMLINVSEAAKAFPPITLPYTDLVTGQFKSSDLPTWITDNLPINYGYNPQKAYQLLESVGFKRGADGKWYMPNGKPFHFEVLCVSAWADWVSQASNLAAQWQAHGIDAVSNCVDVGVYSQLWSTFSFDVTLNWDIINPAGLATAYTAYLNRYWPSLSYLSATKFNYTWPVPLKNGTVIYVNPYYEQMKLQASVPGTSSFWDAIAKLAWFWNYYIPTYPIWNFRRGWQVSIVESNFAELLGVPDAQIDVGGYKMYGWGIDKSWVATAWYSGSYSVYVWMMYGILKKPTTPLPWPPSKPPVNPYNLLPSEAKIVSITDLAKPFLSPTSTPTTSPTTTVTTPPVTTAPPPTTAMTTTVTKTVVVPTTIVSTVVSTVSSVSTATLTATTTVTQRVTEWATTIAIAIVLLIIGFAIGWITKRR
jgi:hypothetical protein